MLSVLIPSYNWDAYSLVETLFVSLQKENIAFEILVLDDASPFLSSSCSEKINRLPNCSFVSLPKNIGRSKIRNLLVEKANYNWLLFLDSDVMPKHTNFVARYIASMHVANTVVVGGICYEDTTSKKTIRWQVGKNNEEKSVTIRNAQPYNFFFTGNFLIRKAVFVTIRFSNHLAKYGYEDLLFAKQLQQHSVAITHIENEVYHLGIDSDREYVAKTKDALKNLAVLLVQKQISFSDTKLSKYYKIIAWTGIPSLLEKIIDFLEEKAINSSSFFYYNAFRIGYLSKVFKETL